MHAGAAAGTIGDVSIVQLVEAVAALDPQPRRQRWTSLSYCILDAVWSFGPGSADGATTAVQRLAHANRDDDPQVCACLPLPADPLPLPALLARYSDSATLPGCPVKAEVVLRHARAFVRHQVLDLPGLQALLQRDSPDLAGVDEDLSEIAGDDRHGSRRGYLWLLTADDERIKPDRMVLRWLAKHGRTGTVAEARQLLREVAAELTRSLDRPVTPWMIGQAIHSGWTTNLPDKRSRVRAG
jgi:hypothetical protein